MNTALLVVLGLCALAGIGWVFYKLGPLASGLILTGGAPW